MAGEVLHLRASYLHTPRVHHLNNMAMGRLRQIKGRRLSSSLDRVRSHTSIPSPRS